MALTANLDWGNFDRRDCVLRYVTGPHLLGIDDPPPAVRDEVAVVIEPPEYVIGPRRLPTRPHETHGLRLTQLSLREFVRRLLGGNLTTMLPLLAPDEAIVHRSQLGSDLFGEPADLLEESLPRSLVAYLRDKRPELPDRRRGADSYDAELALLLIRLGHQGLQALNEQRVTLPVPEPLRGHLRRIRAGEARLADVLNEVDELIEGLKVAPLHMRIPPVDLGYEQALISIYREHWDETWRPIGLE